MFENYPKKRIELPEKLAEIYYIHYKNNREGNSFTSGISQLFESWMHKKVAEDVKRTHSKRTLEVGAGTLNQLKYEQSDIYDIIEPFEELYRDSACLAYVRNIYKDISEIDLSDRYDRITSVATFEHIVDLPKVVAKSCLLLNNQGTLRTSIPSEGTLLWRLAWILTTGVEFKIKYNLDYGLLMKHEHVNTATEIEEILNYFYEVNECKLFGISKNLSLYRFYESSLPRIDLAKEYLKNKA